MKKIPYFIIQKFIASIIFCRALAKAPFKTGMICPSSPFLTKTLAKQISDALIAKLQEQQVMTQMKRNEKIKSLNSANINTEKQAYILELGAGTGAVTKALLKRGVPPSRLLVFEQAESMASLLRQRFPGLRIIQDDAAKMHEYLPKNAYIATIVSSLPFVSLPIGVSENIIEAIKDNLDENTLIQYTYALNQKTLLEEKGFIVCKKETVWLNLPPANVMNFKLHKQ